MHHHESECHVKRLVCCFQGHSHSKGSYDHDSLYNIFRMANPFVIKLGLIVHYHKPVSLHTCLPLWLYHIRSYKSQKSIGHSWKQQQTQLFRFFLRVAEAFVLKLTEATFGRIAHAQKQKYADLLGGQVPFVKTFRVQGRAWQSLFIVHLQNCHQRKGDVSKRLRKYAVRRSLWSP